MTGKIGSRVAPSSSHSSGRISILASPAGGSVGILTCQSVSALLHLEKFTISGSLGSLRNVLEVETYQERVYTKSSARANHSLSYKKKHKCHPRQQHRMKEINFNFMKEP